MTNTVQKNKQSGLGMLADIIICIVLPTLILKKLSGDDSLGSVGALVFALSLPLAFGIYQFWQEKKIKFVPALGFINILLTGGIGLLQLDAGYIAIKEAAIPAVIGLATLISLKTKTPLIKMFIYNETVMNIERVDNALAENKTKSQFNKTMINATWMLAGSFLLSAILNYGLAKYLITAPSGTAEFNNQLGSMTALSYPVIALPCMVVMIVILFYIIKQIRQLTGLKLEEILNT